MVTVCPCMMACVSSIPAGGEYPEKRFRTSSAFGPITATLDRSRRSGRIPSLANRTIDFRASSKAVASSLPGIKRVREITD